MEEILIPKTKEIEVKESVETKVKRTYVRKKALLTKEEKIILAFVAECKKDLQKEDFVPKSVQTIEDIVNYFPILKRWLKEEIKSNHNYYFSIYLLKKKIEKLEKEIEELKENDR